MHRAQTTLQLGDCRRRRSETIRRDVAFGKKLVESLFLRDQLAAQLGLTDPQRRDVQAIFDRMSATAKTLGSELIAQEQALDQLFAKGDITPDRLAATTTAIAELQGRLRAVHLSAHLETRALLNPAQITRYDQLRGYGDTPAPVQHHHHG